MPAFDHLRTAGGIPHMRQVRQVHRLQRSEALGSHLKAAPAGEHCSSTRALGPGSASRQERTEPPSPCTQLSTLYSQQDHKGPFILRYEICVLSLLFFNETLFILGF